MPSALLLLAKLRKGGDGAICTNNVSFQTLEQFIPTTKADYEKQKAVKHTQSLDQGQSFTASKVRATVSCDSCGADRVIFFWQCCWDKEGAKQESIGASLENGYIYGNAINEEGSFYVKRQMRCGDFIESWYYTSSAGALDICAICYERQGIFQADEICKKRDTGGKNLLLVCRYCFDKNFEIPCSGGRVNVKQKKAQDEQTKRKSLDKQCRNGCRKERKS